MIKLYEKVPLEVKLWLGLDWDRPIEECWIWKKAKDKKGYGAIGHEGKVLKTHRVVYELAHNLTLGPEDSILHLCDNRACANPSHLLRGNHTDNEVDQAVKLRGRFKVMSESYARFLYEKLKQRFENDENKGIGCNY